MSGVRGKRTGGGSKKEVDLTAMVQSGAHGAYEALQLYRSRATRCKSKSDYDEAINVCSSGTICLLENGYENAGAELADLFIELLTELNKPLTDELRDVIVKIDSKFPVASLGHRMNFLKACIKWSVTVGSRELGDPKLHTQLAECLWVNHTTDKATHYHYAAGESPTLLAQRIFETFHDPINQKETRSRQLTLGIVNFLALENLRDANELFHAYRKQEKALGNDDNTMNALPLVNFCDYLLQTCRRDAAPLFKTLVNTYAATLDFDESVPTLLMGPIAVKFFGIKPKVNPMMSMLQSMMS